MSSTIPSEPAAPIRRPRRLALAAGVALMALLGAGAGLALLPEHTAPAAAQAAAPPPAIPVAVAVVTQHDTTLWNEFSGRVEAVGRVEVRPRAAGAIVAAHFREGALVHEGDLLFTIDPAPYAAEVDRNEAQVTAATAHLALAQKEQARGLQLVGSGAMAQRDVDQRVNNFREAEANLRAARAALDTARLNLGYTEVRAPISGRVGKIEVTPGNLVPAGPAAPVLTTLVSINPIYASFEADEHSVARALGGLQAGEDRSLQLARIPVRMGTLTTPGTPFEGRLQLVDNVVDGRSGTIRVRAVFANEDGQLMPGQFARLQLGQARPEPVMAIDERAIGTDQDRRFVLVVGADNKAVYREVQLGGASDGLRVVTGGLRPGERIVVNGLQRIRPGALVAPQEAAMNPKLRVAAQ
jgi:membrane fusion protein, multidrug efflux system